MPCHPDRVRRQYEWHWWDPEEPRAPAWRRPAAGQWKKANPEFSVLVPPCANCREIVACGERGELDGAICLVCGRMWVRDIGITANVIEGEHH